MKLISAYRTLSIWAGFCAIQNPAHLAWDATNTMLPKHVASRFAYAKDPHTYLVALTGFRGCQILR